MGPPSPHPTAKPAHRGDDQHNREDGPEISKNRHPRREVDSDSRHEQRTQRQREYLHARFEREFERRLPDPIRQRYRRSVLLSHPRSTGPGTRHLANGGSGGGGASARSAADILRASDRLDKSIRDTHFGHPEERSEERPGRDGVSAPTSTELRQAGPGFRRVASTTTASMLGTQRAGDGDDGDGDGVGKNDENEPLWARLADLKLSVRIRDRAGVGDGDSGGTVRSERGWYASGVGGRNSGIVVLSTRRTGGGRDDGNGGGGGGGADVARREWEHGHDRTKVREMAYHFIAAHLIAQPEGLVYILDGSDATAEVEGGGIDVAALVDVVSQSAAMAGDHRNGNGGGGGGWPVDRGVGLSESEIEAVFERVRVVRVFDTEGVYDAMAEIEHEYRTRRRQQRCGRGEQSVEPTTGSGGRVVTPEGDVIVIDDDNDKGRDERYHFQDLDLDLGDDDGDDDNKGHDRDGGPAGDEDGDEEPDLLPGPPTMIYFTDFPPRPAAALDPLSIGGPNSRIRGPGWWTTATTTTMTTATTAHRPGWKYHGGEVDIMPDVADCRLLLAYLRKLARAVTGLVMVECDPPLLTTAMSGGDGVSGPAGGGGDDDDDGDNNDDDGDDARGCSSGADGDGVETMDRQDGQSDLETGIGNANFADAVEASATTPSTDDNNLGIAPATTGEIVDEPAVRTEVNVSTAPIGLDTIPDSDEDSDDGDDGNGSIGDLELDRHQDIDFDLRLRDDDGDEGDDATGDVGTIPADGSGNTATPTGAGRASEPVPDPITIETGKEEGGATDAEDEHLTRHRESGWADGKAASTAHREVPRRRVNPTPMSRRDLFRQTVRQLVLDHADEVVEV